MLVPNEENLVLKSKSEDSQYEIEINNIEKPVDLSPDINPNEEKELNKYIKYLESIIRTSPEYKRFIGYLRNNLNLDTCTFDKRVDTSVLKRTTLEFHHYPFNLYEIVYIVMQKYIDGDKITVDAYTICEEVMRLHYELKIGLVPLSKTMHQLAHSGKKFINLKHVKCSYLKFIANYSAQIPSDLIENWNALKALSEREDNGELEDNLLDDMELIVNMGIEDMQPIHISNEEKLHA